MEAAETAACCSEFMNWEVDTSTSCKGLKQEKQLSASQRRYYSLCKRKVRNIDQREDSKWTKNEQILHLLLP